MNNELAFILWVIGFFTLMFVISNHLNEIYGNPVSYFRKRIKIQENEPFYKHKHSIDNKKLNNIIEKLNNIKIEKANDTDAKNEESFKILKSYGFSNSEIIYIDPLLFSQITNPTYDEEILACKLGHYNLFHVKNPTLTHFLNTLEKPKLDLASSPEMILGTRMGKWKHGSDYFFNKILELDEVLVKGIVQVEPYALTRMKNPPLYFHLIALNNNVNYYKFIKCVENKDWKTTVELLEEKIKLTDLMKNG